MEHQIQLVWSTFRGESPTETGTLIGILFTELNVLEEEMKGDVVQQMWKVLHYLLVLDLVCCSRPVGSRA